MPKSYRKWLAVVAVVIVIAIVGIVINQTNAQSSNASPTLQSQTMTATPNMTSVVETAVVRSIRATATTEAGATLTLQAENAEFATEFASALTATATQYTQTPDATATPTATETPLPTYTATATLSNEQQIATGVAREMATEVAATRVIENIVRMTLTAIPTDVPTATPSPTASPTETPTSTPSPTSTSLPTSTATAMPQTLTTGSLIVREDGELDQSYSVFVHDSSVPVDASTVTFNMTAVDGENRMEVIVTVNCASRTVTARIGAGEWVNGYAVSCSRTQRSANIRTSLDFSYNLSFMVDGKTYLLSLL